MGLEDRDYIRNRGTGGRMWSSGSTSWPSVCKWLIIANVGVYLAQIFAPQVTNWLDLSTVQLFKGQIWRLVTTAFCHSPVDFTHILFNMLFLWWFGKTLERMYGSREFLLFYLAGVLAASTAYVALQLYTRERFPAIGASGGVMAVIVLYAIHYPREKIYVMFVLPVEIRWLVLFYVLYDLHPVLLALSGYRADSGVAHAAHLGGAAFGFCYRKFGWNLEGLLAKARGRRRSRTTTKRVSPIVGTSQRHQERERAVDAILKKIADHGQASLTDQERKILMEASSRYRAREK